MKYSALVIVLACSTAGVATGDLVPLTQDRFVRTVFQDSSGTTENRISAPDFLPFSAAIDVLAQQNSAITNNSISTTLSAHSWWAGLGQAASSESVCNVTFSLAQPTNYSAVAHRYRNSLMDDDYGTYRLSLRDAANQVVFNFIIGPGTLGEITRTSVGTLASGEYNLQVSIYASAGTEEFCFTDGDFTLTVPAPATSLALGFPLAALRRRR